MYEQDPANSTTSFESSALGSFMIAVLPRVDEFTQCSAFSVVINVRNTFDVSVPTALLGCIVDPRCDRGLN
jgi:hypothetical protein